MNTPHTGFPKICLTLLMSSWVPTSAWQLYTPSCGLFLTWRGKTSIHKHVYGKMKCAGCCFAEEKKVLTQAGHHCHVDTNICPLQSHAVAKLSHVRGSPGLSSKMWQTFWESNPAMLRSLNPPFDPDMHSTRNIRKTTYSHITFRSADVTDTRLKIMYEMNSWFHFRITMIFFNIKTFFRWIPAVAESRESWKNLNKSANTIKNRNCLNL